MRTLYFTITLILVKNLCDHCSGFINVSENGTSVNNSNNDDQVSETQYATCRISTEELNANAQATVTRVLTGVCSEEAVEKRFENLERTIERRFDEIKETLNKILGEKLIRDYIVDPRQEEIDRYNNTVITTATGDKKMLVSYIRFKKFDEKVSHWDSGMFERSSTIYTDKKKYALYVKIIPRYVNGENDVHVRIGVGVTRGMYDGSLDWPFSLKYQIEILDHSAQEFRSDLISSIIDTANFGYPYNWGRPSNFENADNPDYVSISVPINVIFSDIQPKINPPTNLTTTKFIWQGDLIVKLVVYL